MNRGMGELPGRLCGPRNIAFAVCVTTLFATWGLGPIKPAWAQYREPARVIAVKGEIRIAGFPYKPVTDAYVRMAWSDTNESASLSGFTPIYPKIENKNGSATFQHELSPPMKYLHKPIYFAAGAEGGNLRLQKDVKRVPEGPGEIPVLLELKYKNVIAESQSKTADQIIFAIETSDFGSRQRHAAEALELIRDARQLNPLPRYFEQQVATVLKLDELGIAIPNRNYRTEFVYMTDAEFASLPQRNRQRILSDLAVGYSKIAVMRNDKTSSSELSGLAIKAFDELIKLDPDEHVHYQDKAGLLREAGYPRDAISVYKMFFANNPDIANERSIKICLTEWLTLVRSETDFPRATEQAFIQDMRKHRDDAALWRDVLPKLEKYEGYFKRGKSKDSESLRQSLAVARIVARETSR